MNSKLLLIPQLGAVVLLGLLCGNFLIRTVVELACFSGALMLVVLRGKIAAQPVYVMRRQH